MHFKYVTEDQFNSCIGSDDNNIELSVFHMNIRSLNSKHKLLCQFLDLLHLSFDVIILSKIWSSNISFYWNIFPGYTFYYDLPVLHLALVVWAFFIKNTFVHRQINTYKLARPPSHVPGLRMTPLKQQISLIPFSIEHWYSLYKRRRFENWSDQTFCILLIKDVLSVNLHSVTRPIAYYYYYYLRQ